MWLSLLVELVTALHGLVTGDKAFYIKSYYGLQKIEPRETVGLWSNTKTLDSRGLGLNASGPLLFAAPSVGRGAIRPPEIFLYYLRSGGLT